jgi:hypothetical protein
LSDVDSVVTGRAVMPVTSGGGDYASRSNSESRHRTATTAFVIVGAFVRPALSEGRQKMGFGPCRTRRGESYDASSPDLIE